MKRRMINKETTFIIGAGSSCELELPSGAQLKENISAILKTSDSNFYRFSDRRIQDTFRDRYDLRNHESAEKMLSYSVAAQRIVDGLPMAISIDNFLHTHRNDEAIVEVGKLAIAISILGSERKSLLFYPDDRDPLSCSDRIRPVNSAPLREKSWLPDLAELLFSQVLVDNVESAFENVTFVCFNYDRCLEQFLWLSLRAHFGLREDAAADIVNRIRIIHPYGTVGKLPWQPGGEVPLGSDHSTNLLSISQQIKTFTESAESHISDAAAAAIQHASTIVIMGFGYLDQNLQLLRSRNPSKVSKIFTSAYGVAPPDRAMMYRALSHLTGVPVGAWDDRSRSGTPVYIEPSTCRDLMQHHRLLMSLE